MKKFRLSLDDLSVDTFRVDNPEPGSGTVRGAEQEDGMAAAITGWSWLCGSCVNTCDAAVNTCAKSCGGPVPTGCDTPYCWDRPTTKPITAADVAEPGQYES